MNKNVEFGHIHSQMKTAGANNIHVLPFQPSNDTVSEEAHIMLFCCRFPSYFTISKG